MMEEKESLPAGVVTMLLEGYIKTIAFQQSALYVTLGCWLATVIAFMVYIMSR